MKIRTRIAILVGCLMAIFSLSLFVMQRAQRSEAHTMLANLRHDRDVLLDQLLVSFGKDLHLFAKDYTQWDEMVEFMQSGDHAWAEINITARLPNFSADAAWVLSPNGNLHYSTIKPGSPLQDSPPFEDRAFIDWVRRGDDLHFFQNSRAGLVELRATRVLPSNDIHREQSARGWFIVGRLWNEEYVQTLAHALNSIVTLAPTPHFAPNPAHAINTQRALRDWRGDPINFLNVEQESQSMARLIAGNNDELLLMCSFGVSIILVVTLSLGLWVLRPLHQLESILNTGQLEPNTKLLQATDEFGILARQVAKSFALRDALSESKERLRQSIDLRGRLARDLHDGLIQTIYAAGLGLENIRNARMTDPTLLNSRLASCQQLLDDTLWQVRNFINALEPENIEDRSLTESLATLVATMQSLQGIPLHAEIDRTLDQRIEARQELQLLHIARELLSNALRHANASRIQISLRSKSTGVALLEISDDGCGFDPTQMAFRGRGLANLAVRAGEIGAKFNLDSSPDNGTRASVEFRLVV